MSPIVSVIVPVFRVEAFLPICVDSILGQSCRDIELILVDDGSDDGCPALCDAYAAADARVKCIHKQNAGQSFARRDGVAAASGTYFMFVDSDDRLEPDAVRLMVEAAEAHNADVVCVGYNRAYPNHTFPTPLTEETVVYAGDEVQSLQRRLVGPVGEELGRVEAADRLTPMWGKLYRAEVVAAGRWVSERETGSMEDAIFNLYALDACKTCVILPQCLYDYRKDNQNSTTVRYRPKLAQQWERVYAYMEEFVDTHGALDEYRVALRNRVAIGCLGLSFNEIAGQRPARERRGSLKRILREERRREALRALDVGQMPFKWRLFYGCCRHGRVRSTFFMIRMIQRLKSRVEG